MSQTLSFAAAVSDIPGADGPHSLFTLSQLISDSAKDVRGNRAAALALSRRIEEIVAVVEDEGLDDLAWRHAIGTFEGLMRETLDVLQTTSKRSVVSQLLHTERDREKLKSLEERVEIALEALKLHARVSADAVLTSAQETTHRAQTLDRLNALAAAASKHLDEPAAEARIPPKPPMFYGRAAETQAIVDSVLSGNPGHVAILGGPGMGKTTLALSVLHQPSVESQFGTRRYFIDCSAADGPSGSLRIVAARLGILGTDTQAIQRALRFSLGGAPSLLVLDNFESAWEAPERRVDAEATLQFLVGISSVRLIVTMRGAERPLSVQWSRPFLAPLAPLTPEAAAQVFLSVADASGSDAAMSQLLAHVENVPLGIVLIANLAQSETLDTLLGRWQEETTRMLTSGAGASRLTSLDVSISLSIRCPRMAKAPAALGLLRQLAMLPAGAAETDLALWDSYDPRALATLLRVSLAMKMPLRRAYVLAPIRSFVREHMAASLDEIFVLKSHYFERARTVSVDGRILTRPEDVDLLVHEIPNVEALIAHSLETSHSLARALDATARLCRLHFETGIPAGHYLLPKAIEMAERHGRQELEADLLFLSSAIVHDTGSARQTEIWATRARDLYLAVNADAKYIDAALATEAFSPSDESIGLILKLMAQANAMNDALRSVMCQAHLASRYVRLGNQQLSIRTYEAALRAHREAGLPSSRSYVHMTARLGEAHFIVGNIAQACDCFETAITASQPLRYSLVSAFCSFKLGHLRLKQGFFGAAIDHLVAASVPFGKWGSRDGLLVQCLLVEAHLHRGDVEAAMRACSEVARFQREMGWGLMYALLAQGVLALHDRDFPQAHAIMAALRADWYYSREVLRNDLLYSAELSLQEGTLAQLEGDDDSAFVFLIVSAISNHRLGTAIDVVVNLVQLSEVVDVEMSQVLLSTAMLPLLRFDYNLDLARALLQSARVAQRMNRTGEARTRARSAMRRYQMIEYKDGCEKVASFISALDQ